jgi:septal ring factor EnvC (AmiA/AmiB activator)
MMALCCFKTVFKNVEQSTQKDVQLAQLQTSFDEQSIIIQNLTKQLKQSVERRNSTNSHVNDIVKKKKKKELFIY